MSNNPKKSGKKWLKLTITCDLLLSESISDYLVGVIGAAVEIGVEDQLTEQILHAYLEEENPTSARVSGVEDQVKDYLTELAGIFSVSVPRMSSTILEDEDWSSSWKKYFKPFTIIPGLVIVPTWESYTPATAEKVIEMDPGMAFGTGHHATTSLCMGFIRDTLAGAGQVEVLDVGTGTGILGMAAALFGASAVLGIDNDPDAVEAAVENVRHNSLQERMKVSAVAVDTLQGEYGLVVANIIHDVLLTMAPDLARLTASGGSLVLSGILQGEQAENIIAHFSAQGFALIGREERGEWAALHFSRVGSRVRHAGAGK